MPGDRESKFTFYSVGFVAKHKERGTDIIHVFPFEELPHADGDINEAGEDYTTTGKNHKGVEQSGSVSSQMTFKARWLPLNQSNRISAPDVYAGETVMVYRYADDDMFYWNTMMREPKLRRLETVTWMFSDLKDGSKAYDKNSSYWFEVSTHDKKIQLHTSNSDGEPFIYDVIFDLIPGQFALKDNLGNMMVLDSKKQSVTTTGLKQVTHKNAKGDIIDITPGNINIKSTGSVNVSAQTANVTASNGAVIDGGSALTLKGSTISIVSAGGKMSMGGSGSQITGNFDLKGNMTGSGSINTTGSITASGAVHGSNI